MPADFLANETECPNKEDLGSTDNDLEHGSLQAKEDLDDAQSCHSYVPLKSNPQPKSKSRSKNKRASNPSISWKAMVPKRGISKLIFRIVTSANNRTGVSLQTLKKSVAAAGYQLEKQKNYFNQVLRNLVANGLLRKVSGRGLTGSYVVSRMMGKVLKNRK